MAWTAPMTFVAGAALTAAQLNTHLRDNLFETEVAKVTVAGQYLVTVGQNHIEARTPTAARINTTETSNSTDWADLATVGPTVTVTSGSICFIAWKCDMFDSVNSNVKAMSFGITGLLDDGSDGTALDPRDSWAIQTDGDDANSGNSVMNTVLITQITPGLNTVIAKYRVNTSTNTGSFRYRVIAVFPF